MNGQTFLTPGEENKTLGFLDKKNRTQAKRIYHTLVILGVGGLYYLLVVLVQPLYGFNQRLTDGLFVPEDPTPNVVIVGIDDEVLSAYGRLSEWPRRYHAQAISNLAAAGARTIGFDVLFVDSSPDDQILASAMRDARNVVVPEVLIDLTRSQDSKIAYNRPLKPVAPLLQEASKIGHVNIIPDPDGVVRRLPLVVQDSSGQDYPAFVVSLLNSLFNLPSPKEYRAVDHGLNIAGRRVPVDDAYRMRINYGIELDRFRYIPYGKVIKGEFDPSVVRNKVVLIGVVATGEIDSWPTPIAISRQPGVFIHAAAVDTILRQKYLTEITGAITNLILLILLAVTALVFPLVRLRWRVLVTVGLFTGYAVAALVAFDRGYIPNIVYPLMELPFIFVGSVLFQVASEQSDKHFVKDLFGRYVSPGVAKRILHLAETNSLKLGGERRDVTVMFADVRGFTEMSEASSPEFIVQTLNTYFSVIIDRVLNNNGMVNKFAGDNIMAVWNAPQVEGEHARLAIKAAGEAQQLMAEMQKNDASLPKIKFGIGINTGEALAGNIGSAGRVEYTVIGDTVNLASRICGATPGGQVWIGQNTYEAAKAHLDVKDMGLQTFKGKAKQEPVYQVVRWD